MLFNTLIFSSILIIFGPVNGFASIFSWVWGITLVVWSVHLGANRSVVVMISISFLAISLDVFEHYIGQILVDHHSTLNGIIQKSSNENGQILSKLHWRGIPISGSIQWSKLSTKGQMGDRCIFVAKEVKRSHRVNPGITTRRLDWYRHHLGRVQQGDIQCFDEKQHKKIWWNKTQDLFNRFQYSGLMRSLLFGDRSHLTQKTKAAFKESGTSHLLAISGLHMSVFYIWIKWIVGLVLRPMLCRPWFRERIIMILASFLVCSYAWISGASMSSVRCSMMFVIVAFYALYFKKPMTSEEALHIAFRVLLIYEPRWLADVGFMLSVSSMALLHPLAHTVKHMKWFKVPCATVIFSVAQYPIQLSLWGYIPVHGMVVNLILIPLFSIFFPLLVLFSIMLIIGIPFSESLMFGMDAFIQILVQLLQWINQQGGSIQGELSLDIAVHLYISALLLISHECNVFSGLLTLCSFVLSLILMGMQSQRSQVFFFDVDHGLSVLVKTRNHALLYDTGLPEVGDELILSLQSMGVKHLDVLMISHHDRDHSGNQWKITHRFNPNRIMGSDSVLGEGIIRCVRGQTWQWDGVQFEVMHPSTHQMKKNNQSCVLSIHSKNRSVLLTGDIERKAEHEMVAQNACRKFDVVLIPHHGSKTSSSDRFINCFKTQLGILSEGNNPYGLPSREIMGLFRSICKTRRGGCFIDLM